MQLKIAKRTGLQVMALFRSEEIKVRRNPNVYAMILEVTFVFIHWDS